jgi:hypothetical protein
VRFVFLACVAVAACTAGSCAAASYEGAVFKRGSLSYRTGALPPQWKRFRVEDANLAFKHEGGGAIVANGICGENDKIEDLPLDVLVNHALFGVEATQEVDREEFKLDARAALRSHVTGTVDGAQIELDLVVLKKDNCTFDFQLVARPDEFKARRADFEAFYKSFHKLSTEAPR